MLNGILRNGIYLAMIAIPLVGCQKDSSTAEEKFQQQAEVVLGSLTNKYSRAFQRQSSGGRNAFGDWDSSTAPWGQGYYGGQPFYPQVDVRARHCVEMVRQIPKTRATYGARSIKIFQCLNAIISERNFLTTWGYNAGSPLSQNYYAYGNAFPMWGSYQYFGQQQFQVYHNWLGAGFAQ